MTERTYRAKNEIIEYFRKLAFEYEKEAVRTEDRKEEIEYRAKSEAYDLAAFEIEKNMR